MGAIFEKAQTLYQIPKCSGHLRKKKGHLKRLCKNALWRSLSLVAYSLFTGGKDGKMHVSMWTFCEEEKKL